MWLKPTEFLVWWDKWEKPKHKSYGFQNKSSYFLLLLFLIKSLLDEELNVCNSSRREEKQKKSLLVWPKFVFIKKYTLTTVSIYLKLNRISLNQQVFSLRPKKTNIFKT